jgi:protocatechuate 3,4-dioxygenase beta subunit
MERRHFLGLAGLLPLATPLLANTRTATPSQAEGPFYPVTPIPERTDLIVNAQAVEGEAMLLKGRVVNLQGQPLAGIRVEIWQCDGKGLYDHPRQPQTKRFDPNFSGFGAVTTDAQGAYQFRTLYPVPYTGRPPHIHAKLWRGNREVLTTQLYLRGQTETNEWFNVGREHLQIAPQRDAQNRLSASFEFTLA